MSGSVHIYNFTDILNAGNVSHITQTLGNSSKLDIFMTVNAQSVFCYIQPDFLLPIGSLPEASLDIPSYPHKSFSQVKTPCVSPDHM